ncbi:MAG TPA: BadF/BadG/BcrA/BcrD ATPase family protein [Gaiellaceae bacterium]|nr:BadF/BadG/BcrA/BcrD ATPase family protein [Gaiellaceae bacterium]
MGVILGVDGGNSKTELVAASTDGEVLALVRGPGSSSHAIGAAGTGGVIDTLAREAGVALPADVGVYYLCGADVPSDIAELEEVVAAGGFSRASVVDNDTFALLRAGTGRDDAIAVICGSGINCVGRAANGRVARYPSLGWETGDWGGGDMLAREAIFLAARAEDGRGEQTALVEAVGSHFGAPSVEAVGVDVHYRRLPHSRLAELAPVVVAAAEAGDRVARSLVDRLAREIALLVERALRDLGVDEADVVLGGGMLASGAGFFYDLVVAGLPRGVHPIALTDRPVVGAALAALDVAGAGEAAKARLREELRGR